ncbi:af291909_2recq family helicase [Fusarium sporotrichioides]|uniref:Af291909_2recq family helicase n=1 Tax=Fusarium sporotrichioides TaxID=5514 RepID=A0A395RH47_FUSSP|nr:af291909_2recq family helicase [Fusarium sporotrichioides]
MATIAQPHLLDPPPSNTNSNTEVIRSRAEGSGGRGGEGRWLLYNEEYRSLICAFHGYAVRVHILEGHLRERHPDLCHQARSDLVRRHKGLLPTLLEEGPKEDQLAQYGPSNPAEPVEGLPIHRGFACTWPGCPGYLTPRWKCLRIHLNGEHNAKADKRKTREDLWASVHLQTFFAGPKRAIRYFCVRAAGRGGDKGGDKGGEGRGGTSERRRRQGEDDETEKDEIKGDRRPSSSRRSHDSPNSDEGLQERILQVLADFWTQRLDGDPFVSPLWHFVGVLGIDGETGQLRPAHLFTYVLAGLVFTGRALLGEWAIPTREQAGMEDLTQRFAQVRDAWLCKATYSAMGYILSLLLFGKKIARETGSRLMVSWSKQGEIMYFMSKVILMEDLRTIVARMTVDAEDLLWGRLMFEEGHDKRFMIPLAGIEDDLTQTRRGQSFIHRNGLADKEVEILEDLIASSRKTDLLDQTGEWKWVGIRKYLKLVKRFEEFLLLLAHITGGQPSRGEEITGLRLINGINRDRNIFIIDGEVILVTQYHKSLAHFDSPKVIPRFLPGRIGQLFVMYMIYIRPLTDRWEADKWELYGEKMAPPSDFIWHNEAAGGVP